MAKLIYIVGILILVTCLIGCQEQPFYQSSFSFKNHTWSRLQKPTFKVIVKDTSVRYNFILTVRTSTTYAFNNLWLYFNSKTPSKQSVREPYEEKISDKKGYWLGKKTGSIVENKLLFKQRKLPHPGVYYFMLEQGITKKVLYDVLDIGLEIREYSSH
jgi:gliding motility-associated lipoprotein GldH